MKHKRIQNILFFSLMLSLIGCTIKDPLLVGSTDPLQYETPFAEIPSTSQLIMYEINEGAFSSSQNFEGIISRLDSIKSLNVNAIWLMPIYPVGILKSIGSPYCVKNYTEINPQFGTLESLRKLVHEAHNRKIAVILDWVANHTSWDHPWIANKSWYTQDSNGNIISPPGTNWTDVADLNYDNTAMRLEMIKSMKYWILTANVDGFRCDAADYVPFTFWKQAIDSLQRIPNRKLILLAEGNRSDHFSAGFQLNFSWDFFSTNINVIKYNYPATDYFLTQQNEYANIPNGDQKLRFTTNHDENSSKDAPIGLFGGRRASMAAFVIATFTGGVPLIYDGQEVGCKVVPFSVINWNTDRELLKEYQYLMGLHVSRLALQNGVVTSYPDQNIVSFTRKSLTDEAFIIVNVRNTGENYTVPAALQNTKWTDAFTNSPVTFGTQLSLDTYGYRIFYR